MLRPRGPLAEVDSDQISSSTQMACPCVGPTCRAALIRRMVLPSAMWSAGATLPRPKVEWFYQVPVG
jgi:hypothetical protein